MAENTIKGAKTLATARSLTIARLLANKLSAEKPSNNAGHDKFLLRAAYWISRTKPGARANSPAPVSR